MEILRFIEGIHRGRQLPDYQLRPSSCFNLICCLFGLGGKRRRRTLSAPGWRGDLTVAPGLSRNQRVAGQE